MRVYLDICCLKRPFDDPSQARIRLESEAVLSLMDSASEKMNFIHAPAHDLENDQNTMPSRRKYVRKWLKAQPLVDLPDKNLATRTKELMALGFKNFDAMHLASAELAVAEVFATCDDRLLSLARRHSTALRIKVLNPIELSEELSS